MNNTINHLPLSHAGYIIAVQVTPTKATPLSPF